MISTDYEVSRRQREQYEREGYFITEPLFDRAALAGLRGEFERLWRSHIQECEARGDRKQIELARIRPFLSRLVKRSAVCADFCFSETLQRLAEQMLGPDVDFTWDQAILKPPAPSNAFAWHQDGHYAVSGEYGRGADHAELIRFGNSVTFWIAVTRTTVENGTLWVVPGMHRQGLLPHIYSNEQLEWQCQLDTRAKIPVLLQPGQALVFTNLVPHGSGSNSSDETRMAYQLGYMRPGILKNTEWSPLLRGGRRVG